MQTSLFLTRKYNNAERHTSKTTAINAARGYMTKFPEYTIRIERVDPTFQATHGFWVLACLQNGDFVGYILNYQDKGLYNG